MNDFQRTMDFTAEAGFVPGCGKNVESLNAEVLEIGPTDIPVLILGESGTGKDVYGRLLHRLWSSPEAPLQKASCALLDPAHLIQWFQGKAPGPRHRVDRRSLFLDGLDELDQTCQRTLLHLLIEKEGQPGGHSDSIRLISLSSGQLEEHVKTGRFRKELYFRINGICLRLPPLRERKEDIGEFLEHFLQKYSAEFNKAAPELTPEAVEILQDYDWPGNVRELENIARKMVALGSAEVTLDDIRIQRKEPTPSVRPPDFSSLKLAARTASRERERELIMAALERTKWNRKRAARELQISYKTLLYKLKQIGLPGEER